jgi:hypothetical protein
MIIEGSRKEHTISESNIFAKRDEDHNAEMERWGLTDLDSIGVAL